MDFRPINLQNPRKKRKLLKRYRKILLFAAVVILAMFIWSSLSSTSSVFQFAFPLGSRIKSTDDRVNILLLGNAGGAHEGPSLTDSIIVASYHLDTHQVTLISIPRDLWIESAKAKVNTIYQKGGLKYAEDKIDDILGFPIHYGVRLDFSGFGKAIDLIEGVEVGVAKSFDDYTYPIEGKENDLCGLLEKEVELTEEQIKELNLPESNGSIKLTPGKNKVLVDTQDKIATSSASFACRFEHIHFDQGKTNMDGEEALKFVRSRQGTNGEGSDFARSRRQQLVLQAFKDKVLTLETLANPQKVAGLISTFGKSLETDIDTQLILDFYNLVKKIEKTHNLVLGDLGKGRSVFITGSPKDYGGAYALIPPNNDFSEVKKFLKEEFKKQEQEKK